MNNNSMLNFDTYYSTNYKDLYQEYQIIKSKNYGFSVDTNLLKTCKLDDVSNEWYSNCKKFIEDYYKDNTKNCKNEKRLKVVIDGLYQKDGNRQYGWPLSGIVNPPWYQQREANHNTSFSKFNNILNDLKNYIKDEKECFCGCEECKLKKIKIEEEKKKNDENLKRDQLFRSCYYQIEELLEDYPFTKDKKISSFFENLSTFLQYIITSEKGKWYIEKKYAEIKNYLYEYVEANKDYLNEKNFLIKLENKYKLVYGNSLNYKIYISEIKEIIDNLKENDDNYEVEIINHKDEEKYPEVIIIDDDEKEDEKLYKDLYKELLLEYNKIKSENNLISTDMFSCNECKSRDCKYCHGKKSLKIIIICNNCDNVWTF